MPSTQCNSSMALSDLPDAPRRRAEALNGIRGSMAYSLHSLLGVGVGGRDPRLCSEGIKKTAIGAFRGLGCQSKEVRLLLVCKGGHTVALGS